MRLLIVSVINEPWGGSEALWASLADEAISHGHTVAYCTYDFREPAAPVAALVNRGLQLVPRAAYVPGSAARPWRILQKLWFAVRNRFIGAYNKAAAFQPDVVVYNGTSTSIASDRSFQKFWQRTSAKTICLAHFTPDFGTIVSNAARQQVAGFLTAADAVWFIAGRTKTVTERFIAQPLPHATVVRNPVNMPSTDYLPFPAYEGTARLAMVGNLLCMHKGQDVMLQVLGSEAWRAENWTLDIYGDGMDRAYLEQLVQMYGIGQKVRFCGRVSDIRGIWASHHLLLMPSVMEGMPLAVVEAMLCGRPVLATDVGGHVEWIEDGVQGYIAAAPTATALHIALQAAWSDLPHWEQRGRAAHEKAMKLYDPAAGATLLKLIEEMLLQQP